MKQIQIQQMNYIQQRIIILHKKNNFSVSRNSRNKNNEKEIKRKCQTFVEINNKDIMHVNYTS